MGTSSDDAQGRGGAPPPDPRRWAFLRIPVRCRAWVTSAVLAALLGPLLLVSLGQRDPAQPEALTGLLLVVLSVLNVEIGRLLEGGVSDSQRPHKALSAWSFAAALLLPTWWLLPVVAVSYSHTWWRGLRVPIWKWVGSASYIVLAGLAAAVVARAVTGAEPNLMHADALRGLLAILAGVAVFLAVETVLFHGSAYLNDAADEEWLRQTLRSPSFYLTEAGVLAVGGLSAAIWTGGPWLVLLLVPVYVLTQRAALHEPLRQRAERDDKTGLLRFESWRLLAMAGSEQCRVKQRPWSVLFADLDHFKRFNDTWGHVAGDEALVAVARTLRAQLRTGDILARFGGEEFCVFLPATGADDAARIAERMRAAVAREIAEPRPVTISLGLASVEPTMRDVTLAAAFATADKALFQAKAEGRNTTRLHLVGAAES